MKFNSTPTSLSQEKIKQAQSRFYRLTLELGIRENNEYVGSGLGGNNFQLMVLLGLHHHLINSTKTEMRVQEGRMCWSYQFFMDNGMKTIRKKLDAIFPAIVEKNKVMALAMQSISNDPSSLCKTCNTYYHNFPSLVQLIENRTYTHDPLLTHQEAFILATLMTAKLASDLDRGDESLVEIVGKALQNFTWEIVLLTVRRNIQIDRLVRYNLDEHPTWAKLLSDINKGVDS